MHNDGWLSSLMRSGRRSRQRPSGVEHRRARWRTCVCCCWHRTAGRASISDETAARRALPSAGEQRVGKSVEISLMRVRALRLQ
jgi:hypothetical protein